MIDAIGNTLEVGNLLWWTERKMVVRVTRIETPSNLSVIGHAQKAPPHIAVEIVIGINMSRDAKSVENIQLGEFVRIVDPAAEAALAAAMGGVKQ